MGLFSREAQTVEVAGRALRCQVCSYELFWHERAQLHGGLATFFGMEWTSPTADCYLCGQCGYVHWFIPLKE
ncbi:hypothetical protein [Roseisolibacter agri]|uniref:DNA-binding protein n=1 Tax=Roseisolibacter agri TaxID=2014610 RepID=A0AA37Q3I3_9BACT|nr:hypothetical protein [Roseisolibacter agri]GLC25895.1 hypothetical protein rosag_24080 [Roseisolibacter agri]